MEKDFHLNIDWNKEQDTVERITTPPAKPESIHFTQEPKTNVQIEAEKPQLSPIKIFIILAVAFSLLWVYVVISHNEKFTPSENTAPVYAASSSSSTSDFSVSLFETNVIKGSNSYDITLGLEENGIPRGIPEKSKVDDGKYITSTANVDGVMYEYHMSTTQADEITFASFSILYATDDKNLLNSVASDYLGFCATIPYDGAAPEDAREWVDENIANATQAKTPIQATFSGVKFSLYGTDNSRWLEIKP